MKFPSKIIFKFIDKDTKKPVEDIVSELVLYARRKNDYYSDPKISDKNGNVFFTRDDCLETIQLSQEHFIMDYASSLEECLAKISLQVLDIDRIKFTIENFKKFEMFWKKHSIYRHKDKFLNKLKMAKNRLYKPMVFDFEESSLKEESVVEIEIERNK